MSLHCITVMIALITVVMVLVTMLNIVPWLSNKREPTKRNRKLHGVIYNMASTIEAFVSVSNICVMTRRVPVYTHTHLDEQGIESHRKIHTERITQFISSLYQ